MGRAVRQSQREVSPSGAGIVEGGIFCINGHRDREWRNFNDVDQEIKIASEADVCSTVDQ
jgi:hypothetical protein